MSYRIVYDNGVQKTYLSDEKPVGATRFLKWGLVLALLVLLMALHQNADLRRFLLPGNKEVTEAAALELIDAIQQGEKMSEAVAAFCRQIVANGK